ncbi:MAG: hypothetical protein ACKVWV_17645 [Planctomycetota bacterium]
MQASSPWWKCFEFEIGPFAPALRRAILGDSRGFGCGRASCSDASEPLSRSKHFHHRLLGKALDLPEGVDQLLLVRRTDKKEYEIVERKSLASATREQYAGLLERALWGNARGIPKAP